MKKYIKHFFKEIIPVIIGILIALWINNWNENRKNQMYLDEVYSLIKKDLNETDQKIKEMLTKQKNLSDTINKYKNNNKLTLFEILIKANGFHAPTIRNSFWKALSNSKIELLEYNKAATLSNIDNQSDILKMKIQHLMNFAYSNISKTEKAKKQEFQLFLNDIMISEKSLQKEIQKINNE